MLLLVPERPVTMSAGSNVGLPAHTADNYVELVVSHKTAPGVDLDLAVVAVGPNGRVAVDDDFVFYNNPRHPSGSVEHLGQRVAGGRSWDAVRIQCGLVPQAIVSLHATLSGQHQGFPAVPDLRVEVVDHQRTTIASIDLSNLRSESAAILLEVYRRADVWKLRAVAQGWDAGFSALVEHYGLEVGEDASTPFASVPVQPADGRDARPPAVTHDPRPAVSASPTVWANWYPDPFHRYQQRYWDGNRWTHDVSTNGTQSFDPPVATPSAPPPPCPTRPQRLHQGHRCRPPTIERLGRFSDRCRPRV